MKAKVQSVAKLIQKLQITFNAFIRIRDKGKPCISCGAFTELQAGHYYSAGHYSWLRFDEMNVNGQCVRCNYHLHGNQVGYRVGLINKYGKNAVDQLELKAQLKKVNKWARFELQVLNEHYKERIVELSAKKISRQQRGTSCCKGMDDKPHLEENKKGK